MDREEHEPKNQSSKQSWTKMHPKKVCHRFTYFHTSKYTGDYRTNHGTTLTLAKGRSI